MKRARVRAARAMMTAMRVVGKEEGKGGKAKRLAGERMSTQTKIAMATKTREAGKEEGFGRGGKSNGDGKKDGNGKQQRQQPQQRQ
jgi:hypothetical protein